MFFINFFRMKAVLFFILFIFIALPSFGQIMWSTASGTNIRTIQMNTVKTETLRLWDQYDWFYFDDNRNVHSRVIHRNNREAAFRAFGMNWSTDVRNKEEQIIRWLNNNRRFVFAENTPFGVGVEFVLDDWVYILVFSNLNSLGVPIRTRNETRRDFERFLDELLR